LGKARVVRALAQDRGTLNLLAKLGLVPGKVLRVVEKGDGVGIEMAGEVLRLPEELAQAIGVEALQERAP